MAKIKDIKAREILDSKGNPTVEVDLITEKGVFHASVPSGTSKGKHEALELRDREKRYGGMGVLRAVKNIKEIIAPKLIGKDPTKQKEIDNLMIELDGTENKSNLGANAILPVSIAVCRAGAVLKHISLWEHIFQLTEVGPLSTVLVLPTPCLLLIEGGLHAGNELNVQEFMIAPKADSFSERLRMGTEIYHILEEILKEKYGSFATNVGYEGGFAPPLQKTERALDLIIKAIARAGYKNKVKIILDVAASVFYEKGFYRFEGGTFTKEGLLNFYSKIIEKYPILGLEDPFEQEDFEGWKMLRSKIKDQKSKIFLIGDDLTVTNPKRIERAIEKDLCNALVIKPNQIGTVTEVIEAVKIAKKNGWEVFVKHRSGETNDDFIAHLAVGLGAKYIMAGAPTRGERVAKYNKLLRIEEDFVKK